MEIKFKRLSDCTINEAVLAWNRGFEGYFFQMEMTPEPFIGRVGNEGLSVNYSIVAFDGDNPIAIVMNGIRTVNGKKTAWNGGTGVATEYRGKGVSRRLMEETLRIYSEEGIEIASLEAIKQNERAIRLYERFGYEIIDSLVYLNGTFDWQQTDSTPIQIKTIRPEQLPLFLFYKENVPWQCQWQSAKTGEAQVFFDENDKPLGYALFKRVWNQEGNFGKVLILQLELLDEINNGLVDSFLANLSGHNPSVAFTTVNSSTANPAIKYLMERGFKKSTEQVQMVKKLTNNF